VKAKGQRSEEALRKSVIEALKMVEVPERQGSVYDLKLVKKVQVVRDEVHLVFSPDSHLCSSIQVAFSIRQAVNSVTGVTRVEIHMENYSRLACENGSCLVERKDP
jgi:metal-sulfur cluster biosynthetic enzyme